MAREARGSQQLDQDGEQQGVVHGQGEVDVAVVPRAVEEAHLTGDATERGHAGRCV